MKWDPFPLHFEKTLERQISSLGCDRIDLIGSNSTLTCALALAHRQRHPQQIDRHVVIVPTLKEARQLITQLEFFHPEAQTHLLLPFDVSPYSGLYPHPRTLASRMLWLHKAQQSNSEFLRDFQQGLHSAFQVLIAPIEALQQKTLPIEVFQSHHFVFKVGEEWPTAPSRLLTAFGYQSVPIVEDIGTFAVRGGIVDVFSPAHERPMRIELFGDQIDSIRSFDPSTQRSDPINEGTSTGSPSAALQQMTLIPPREIVFTPDTKERAFSAIRQEMSAIRNKGSADTQSDEYEQILHSLHQNQIFPGIDFLLPHFYTELAHPIQYLKENPSIWMINTLGLEREADRVIEEKKKERTAAQSGHNLTAGTLEKYLYCQYDELKFDKLKPQIRFSKIEVSEGPIHISSTDERSTAHNSQLLGTNPDSSIGQIKIQEKAIKKNLGPDADMTQFHEQLHNWREQHQVVFIAAGTQSQAQRLAALMRREEWNPVVAQEDEYLWGQWAHEQQEDASVVHILPRATYESLQFPEEGLILLRDDDFLGAVEHQHRQQRQREREFQKKKGQREPKAGAVLNDAQTSTLNTSTVAQYEASLGLRDLKPGDPIVHIHHGVGIFDGLKSMDVGGITSEFIQISYKDNDKLYLPVFRIHQIQKFTSPGGASLFIDRLGGPQWEKTKSKVRKHLRDVAAELLELYAQRRTQTRPPLIADESDYQRFEAFFPYDETDDQLKAIDDILGDMTSPRPMDRLVCGDVGFGKTEVAMRAAFRAVQAGFQVAVLAPTTVLSFQHLETFQKRFKSWPIRIQALNRFVPPRDAKKILAEVKSGHTDILIGTHRLLSKDVEFAKLGLLIIDEEQKFGVLHKERIKKLKTNIDTLTLSATPIPRTLNMSLVGMRDLSLINTPPQDRLPTRTFVCRYDAESIRNAITSELQRGGQIFFLHNRVQSIYSRAEELRALVPEARLRVGHGQMDEEELEKTMVAFFHHEIDILLCTTIIESGIDNPRANTMLIDDAHTFGLSQLYQLRGRVGRSKDRAYCYLLIPNNKRLDGDAQERLKIIQDHTALGSGIQIAHHDLELRGAGNFLGEDQSGHIHAVGYELYLELLEEALSEAKGEPKPEMIDPEINLRIPAYIPDDYMPDIRLRLSYYRSMSNIQQMQDMDRMEDDLRDQFGRLPEPVINLMGMMLLRHQARRLGIKDISSGPKTVSLSFTDKTPVEPQSLIQLAVRERQRYTITPDSRLLIRMDNITWPNVSEELERLERSIQ